jgi:predicted kinase
MMAELRPWPAHPSEAAMTLIVVSGAPGTGKSTVAAAVATEFGLPLLSLDEIKEALADVLGTGGEDWSNQVGDAAAEVVFRLCAAFPDAVAEGWWRRARRERAVREFAGAAEVFCHCDPELATARMRARLQTGRHPIHRDVINPAMIGYSAGNLPAVQPLGLGGPLVTVDTGRPGAPGRAVSELTSALGR